MKKLFVALAIAGIALSARAQTTYTSRTLYDLAHPGNFVIDFNGYTPASFQYASVTAPTPGGNVTFAGIQGNIEFLGSGNIGFLGAGNLALYDLSGQFLAESLRVTLPANTFSFGTDLISPSQTIPEPYTINIYSGMALLNTITSPSVYNAYTFVGYDSLTGPITSVTFQVTNIAGSPEPIIDNFTVVPEPTTGLAGALALGAIVWTGRRRLVRA